HARAAGDGLLLAREPVHAVQEEVLVAEELDEEVVRELRVAVHDEPPLLRLRTRRRQRAEGELHADADRPRTIAAGDEPRRAGAHDARVARCPALVARAEK